ncbi:MAG: hypothetical protein ACETWG_10485, partial [Candidatus Neomarinimicrobiota bacterium]
QPGSPVPTSEELVFPDENKVSASKRGLPTQTPDFVPWREEQLPKQAVSGIGHRRVIKKDNVHRGTPVKITHEISLEPEPEPKARRIEVSPIMDGDTVVGLSIVCGCGATHEVRFEYGDEQ